MQNKSGSHYSEKEALTTCAPWVFVILMVCLAFNGMAVPVLAGRVCDWDMVGKVVGFEFGDCTERGEASSMYRNSWKKLVSQT